MRRSWIGRSVVIGGVLALGAACAASAPAFVVGEDPLPVAQLEADPTSVDFGAVEFEPSQSSEAPPEYRTVKVTNVGNAYADALDVWFEGETEPFDLVARGYFSGEDGMDACDVRLAPGASCLYRIAYVPMLGTQQATLAVMPDRSLGDPEGERGATIDLRGTGVLPPPQPKVVPDRVAFYGRSRYDALAQRRVVVVRNPTPATIALRDAVIVGAARRSFAIAPMGACARTRRVAPGGTCRLEVRFTSRAVDVVEASARIRWFGREQATTVALVGTACDPAYRTHSLHPDDGDPAVDQYLCGRRIVAKGRTVRDVLHGGDRRDVLRGMGGSDHL